MHTAAYSLLVTLVVGVAITTCDVVPSARRIRRQAHTSQMNDRPTESTRPPVEISLTPFDRVEVVEGDDITFECKITNKPQNSQVQWYYMIRNPLDNSFDNFTILANEVATVDPRKYRVWTPSPNIYSLKIDEMREDDTGEYCCFLYVTYSETYRKVTTVTVSGKQPPTTTATPTTTTTALAANTHLNEIIEEAVEHDIEVELGKKLDIALIKSNVEARTLIQNATEEIKSLLNVDEISESEFNNGTTKMKVTRKMNTINSQVKTVVSSLISSISKVDASLAKALTPLHKPANQADRAPKPSTSISATVSQPSGSISDWRAMYNQYKQKEQMAASTAKPEDTRVVEIQTGSNSVVNTPSPSKVWDGKISEAEKQYEEELSNSLEPDVVVAPQPSSNSKQPPVSGQKCEYQLVINEFDPSQCPSIGTNLGTAASYYEVDNRKAAAFTREPIGTNQLTELSNDKLNEIEKQLQEEMANSKIVNKTVVMHDGMLHKAEKMLKEQTSNISNLEELVKDLKSKLATTEEEKLNMEEKITSMMLNLLEVNKRLDVAMKDKGSRHYEKEIAVQSSPLTPGCDKHPNVTHFTDCAEIAADGTMESGVYYIKPLYSACPIPVWCDMDTYPGGWTLLQRREGGAVSFNREWAEYRKGFGHVTSEHWLGNDNIFVLSNQNEYMLRIDLWDFYDSRVYSEYRIFKVDGERDGYKLTVGNYSGTAGDGLKSHNKQKFSTSDNDNDMWQDYHCAYEWEGGWWFTNCWNSYLNGRYYNISDPPYNGISWREWKEEQLYRSEMKIRPVFYVRSDPPAADAAADTEAATESASDAEALIQRDQPQQHAAPVRHKYNRASTGK